MTRETGKLVSFALLFAICGWMAINGLRKGKLRSRYGFVISASERPYSFYASIGLYAVLACIGLAGTIRLAVSLSR
jgi:hypothetical protein